MKRFSHGGPVSTQLPGDQVVPSGRLLPTALSIHPFSLVLKHKGKTRGSSIQNSKGSQRNDCNKRREKCFLSSAAFIPHSQVTDIQQDRERTEISWTKAVPGLENQPAHPQNCLGGQSDSIRRVEMSVTPKENSNGSWF